MCSAAVEADADESGAVGAVGVPRPLVDACFGAPGGGSNPALFVVQIGAGRRGDGLRREPSFRLATFRNERLASPMNRPSNLLASPIPCWMLLNMELSSSES